MLDESSAASLPLPLMNNSTTSTSSKSCYRRLLDFFGFHDPLFKDHVEILLGLTYFLAFDPKYPNRSYHMLAKEFYGDKDKDGEKKIEEITRGFPSLFWNGELRKVNKQGCGLHIRRGKEEEDVLMAKDQGSVTNNDSKDDKALSLDEAKVLTDFIQKQADDENARLSQMIANLSSLVLAIFSTVISVVSLFRSSV